MFKTLRKCEDHLTCRAVGLCVVKAGEQCKFQRGLDENSDPVYAIYPCIQNSACDQDGYCSCIKGFFESSDGTCYPGRTYGQSCDDQLLKCLTGAALNCINGSCACDLDSSIYDPSQQACVGLLGETCVEGRCICGACVKGRCTCPSSHFVVNSTTCEAKRGPRETCESQDWCGQDQYTQTDLTCEDEKLGVKKCMCPPKTSVYATVTMNFGHFYSAHSEMSLCAPKPKQPCFRGFCAPSAMCTDSYIVHEHAYDYGGYYENGYGYDFTDHSQPTCQCISPAEVSPTTGECANPYDHICDGTVGCMDSLTCRSGRCGCNETQHYDTNLQQCRLKVSQACGSDFDCVHNSKCTETQSCTCKSGFVPSKEGLCAAEVGGPCETTSDCDQVNNKLICDPSSTCACPTAQHLSTTTGKCSLSYLNSCDNSVPCGDTFVCKQNQCRCPSTLQIFDPIQKRCIHKVGGPCSSNTECVTRAHCKFSMGNQTISFGSCNCDLEAVETKDGLCTLTEDAGCTTDADCDPKAGLECMDQVCKCPTHARYSRQLRTCQGLIGAPCTDSNPCVENAICTKLETTSLTSRCVCPRTFGMTSKYDCVQNTAVNHPQPLENWWPGVPGENQSDDLGSMEINSSN